MTRPRAQIVSIEATPYYHCIARCVRRAWLCGTDRYTGNNFDHRKDWVIGRLRLLGEVFAIDIAAYAIMSNHYHVVLHVDAVRVASWSDEEVIERWRRLYAGPELIQRYKANLPLLKTEQSLVSQIVKRWRKRLCDISWFMRCLNEYLARRANAEDDCKGRFWEARFKSQALLDEAALLSCMAYVDLNPIRAGIATSLEDSDFTSIQERLREVRRKRHTEKNIKSKAEKPRLMPFAEVLNAEQTFAAVPFNLKDYVELVDWTGRVVRQDKKGSIPVNLTKTLEALGLSDAEWQLLALDIQKRSVAMLNGLEKVTQLTRNGRLKAA